MSSLPLPPFDVALVGAGRVGTGVAALLVRAGQSIAGVASRSQASADRAAELLAAPTSRIGDLADADVYLIGTGVDAIEDVVRELATATDLKGRIVVHFAGAAGIQPLDPARDEGAHVCALHPVQACPDIDAAIRNLPGSTWGMTTSEGAETWATDFVALLGGRAVPVAENDRPAWHAAAVVTSNGIAALMASGEAILEGLGVTEPERVLGPLAAGTVTNARLGGGGAATLTGPVVRGEVDVVRTHVAALMHQPRLAAVYRSVSRSIADVAAASGRLDPKLYDEIIRAIGDPA